MPQFPPEGFERNITDLTATIGQSPVDSRWQSTLENPLGGAAMFGLGGAGVQAVKPIEKSTRREFIPYLIAALSFGVLGTLVGGATSYKKKLELEILEQNAKDLDAVYARLYRKTSEVRELSPLVTNYFQRFGISNRA